MPTDIDPRLDRPRYLTEIDGDNEEAGLGKVLNRFYLLDGETVFAEVAEQLGIDITWDLANPNVLRVMDRPSQRVTESPISPVVTSRRV